MGYSFWLPARVLSYAPPHRIVHSMACYTSCEVQWQIAQWVHHEGSIWRPITPSAYITTVKHCAVLTVFLRSLIGWSEQDDTSGLFTMVRTLLSFIWLFHSQVLLPTLHNLVWFMEHFWYAYFTKHVMVYYKTTITVLFCKTVQLTKCGSLARWLSDDRESGIDPVGFFMWSVLQCDPYPKLCDSCYVIYLICDLSYVM